jgi:hypothetical protein
VETLCSGSCGWIDLGGMGDFERSHFSSKIQRYNRVDASPTPTASLILLVRNENSLTNQVLLRAPRDKRLKRVRRGEEHPNIRDEIQLVKELGH